MTRSGGDSASLRNPVRPSLASSISTPGNPACSVTSTKERIVLLSSITRTRVLFCLVFSLVWLSRSWLVANSPDLSSSMSCGWSSVLMLAWRVSSSPLRALLKNSASRRVLAFWRADRKSNLLNSTMLFRSVAVVDNEDAGFVLPRIFLSVAFSLLAGRQFARPFLQYVLWLVQCLDACLESQ